jgi:hypothetical protein
MCKPHHRLSFPHFHPTSIGAPASSWNTARTILSTERHRRWSILNPKNLVAASWTQTLFTNDIIQSDWWRQWLITKVWGQNTPRHRHDWSREWGWEGRVLTAQRLDGLWAELLIIILRITECLYTQDVTYCTWRLQQAVQCGWVSAAWSMAHSCVSQGGVSELRALWPYFATNMKFRRVDSSKSSAEVKNERS